MKYILTLILIIPFSFFSFAQKNEGYYGSKSYICIETLINSPLWYNRRHSYEDKFNNNLENKPDLMNYGFRLTGGFLSRRNVAFCFEGGIDFTDIYPTTYFSINQNGFYYDYRINTEKFAVQHYSFMPKFDFSKKNGLLPLGFSHQLGLGITFSKMVNKEYKSILVDPYEYYNTTIPTEEEIDNALYDFNNLNPVKTFTFLYAISMRTALTKHLLLNYGFRYTFNFYNFFASNHYPYENYINTKHEIEREILFQKTHTVITFNTGLTYAF